MPLSTRLSPVLIALALAGPAGAQEMLADRPAPYVAWRPPTQQELDRIEALKVYALGLFHERDSRLIEAVKTFERALRLDARSAAVHKSLVPLYLALDRTDDALNACKKALELDPGDFATWHLYARQLKSQDRRPEAIDALARGLKCAGLKEHPGLRLEISFELGALHEHAGQFAEAEAAFRTVARALDHPDPLLEHGPFTRDEIDTQAVEVYERLGKVCVKAKHFDAAREAFHQAQAKIRAKDKDAESVRARRLDRNLADVFLAQDRPAEALACLQDYLATQPQGTEAYELKVTLLERLDRRGEVLAALERDVQRDRHNAALKLLLARQYGRAGRPEQGEALFRTVAAEAPDPAVYRAWLAFYQEEEKAGRSGLARALKLFDESVAAAALREGEAGQPSNASDAARLQAAGRARAMLEVLQADTGLIKALVPLAGPRLAHETRFLLAVLAGRTRQLDHAERLYRSCLDTLPAGPKNAEAEVYFGLVRVLSLARKHEAVVDVCRRGLAKAEPANRTVFHIELAHALVMLGKMEEAVGEARSAVSSAGADARHRCRCLLAQVLAQAGHSDEAVAECQALLKEHAGRADVQLARSTLSAVYQIAHDYAHAEEQLQLLLKEDPNDAGANNDLGYIWADQNKNLEEAERMIRRALELDRKQKRAAGGEAVEDNAAYVDSLGWVLFRTGRLEEARQELERAGALPAGADDPVVWDHLGDVHARLGEPDKARTNWARALKLYDGGGRRKRDDRYNEIKQKLMLLEREKQP